MYGNQIGNNAAHQGAGAGTIAAREMEVPSELGQLQRNIAGLRQGLDTLEDRLGSSILRARPPEPAAPAPAPSPLSTPVANQLHEANCTLDTLIERIQSIITRLEA